MLSYDHQEEGERETPLRERPDTGKVFCRTDSILHLPSYQYSTATERLNVVNIFNKQVG